MEKVVSAIFMWKISYFDFSHLILIRSCQDLVWSYDMPWDVTQVVLFMCGCHGYQVLVTIATIFGIWSLGPWLSLNIICTISCDLWLDSELVQLSSHLWGLCLFHIYGMQWPLQTVVFEILNYKYTFWLISHARYGIDKVLTDGKIAEPILNPTIGYMIWCIWY